MNSRSWVVVAVVAAVVGAAAFYGGMLYGESKPPSAEAAMEKMRSLTPAEAAAAFQSGGFPGGPGGLQGADGTAVGGGRGTGGGFINGDVVSADAESITVKLADGSTKIVFFSDSTSIVKSTEGSASDLATGTGIVVTGTTNGDGSVTAERIQIRAPGEGPIGGPVTPPTTAP